MNVGMTMRRILVLMMIGVAALGCEGEEMPKEAGDPDKPETSSNGETEAEKKLREREQALEEREKALQGKEQETGSEIKEAPEESGEIEQQEANQLTREDFVEYCEDASISRAEKNTLMVLNTRYGTTNRGCLALYQAVHKTLVIDLTFNGSEAAAPKITDLEAFKYFKNTKGIRLGGHDVRSIKPLKGLKKLEFLWLAYNQNLEIQEDDLPSGLEDLLLEGTGISDLSGPSALNIWGLSN